MSSASSDSGCAGLKSDDRFCEELECTTTISDVTTTSSLTCTDEDEPRCRGEILGNTRNVYPQLRQKIANRTQKSVRNPRHKRKSVNIARESTSSSCNSSEVGSLHGDEDKRCVPSMDDIVVRIYIYFQHLLYTLRRQQRLCEQFGAMMGELDGRWGSGSLKKSCQDSSGCYVPESCYIPSEPRSLFTGCWAIPHPAVHLNMLSTNVRTYLGFLQKLYPNVVGHGAREGRKNASASEYPGLSDEFLANNLPYLMSVMTGAPPAMQHMPSVGHGEEVARKQSACWQQEQMLNAAQDAASVGNAAYSIRQEHYARMADAASMSNNVNFSPGKRAHRQTDVEASLLTSTSTVSSGAVPNPAVSTGQYVSSANSQPISHNIRQKTGQSLVTAVTTVEQSVRDLSIAEGGDDRRQSGESGYQSETTPTFPQDNSTAVQEEGVNEIVSDEASTVTPSANTTRIPGKTGVGSTSTSSSRRHTSASQTLPTTTPSEPTSTPPTPGAAPSPPPSSLLDATGNFKVSEMDVLSEEIWCYHNSVTQTEATLNRKLHLRDMLYYAICPVFPMCGLYVVGSSLNGFGSNSSDMDLCLMITNKDLDQKTDAAVVLNMILSTLRQVEWVSHQQLIFAKVPILRLKFAAPFADITVDLNANNSVAIKNTHLLCYYSSFDWRVRPLVTIVKEWAKRKGMNDANRSSFTSYSLVLMVIHYLQCGLKPAVLPSLQAMYPKRFNSKCDVRSLNVTLPLTPPPDDWVYNDTATLGELLIGFLYYYAYTFDFNRDAMSIRMGKLVERAFVAKRNPNGHFNNNGNNWRSQWRCICIEEPFTHSNTAHSIYDEMVFSEIKAAFRDAYHELDATRDMQRLMNGEPIKAQPPNGGAMVFTTAYEPRSDHVLAVTVPRSAGPSGSTGSMHTARSGRSSCASSTSGGDNETERNRESPLSQLLGAPVSHAATSTTHAGNGIHHHGMRGSGSSHGKRRSGHHMRKGGTGQRV